MFSNDFKFIQMSYTKNESNVRAPILLYLTCCENDIMLCKPHV